MNFRRLHIAFTLATWAVLGSYTDVTHAATQFDVVTLDFSDAVRSRTFYSYDGDNDGTPDVVLTTADPLGFNTGGPGRNMLFIQEPGIEGTALLTQDLRINFLKGAATSVSFSFALSTSSPNYGATFSLFNARGEQIASTSSTAAFQALPFDSTSSYPENRVDLAFNGTAAYGIFNFGVTVGAPTANVPSRYIVDNVSFAIAGTDTLPDFAGAVPSDPILPRAVVNAPDGSLRFDFDLVTFDGGAGTAFPIFIDPAVAVGYLYEVNSGPNIAAVLVPNALPNGDEEFSLVLDGVGSFALQAGVEFDVTDIVAGGVKSLRIVDIDATEGLDPTDVTAFVTGLRFVSGGAVSVSQSPLTAVPEPATYAMWLLAIGAMCFRRRFGKTGEAC